MDKKENSIKKWQIYVICAIGIIILALIIGFAVYKNGKEKVNIDGENYTVDKEVSYLLDDPSTGLENENLYTEQYRAWLDIMAKYKKGNYTLEKPLVVVNPFEISPLSAIVVFGTDNNVMVTTTLKGKHNDDLVTNYEATKDHYIPIYGLYENYNNEIEIKTSNGKKNTINIKTSSVGEYEKGKVIFNKLTNNSEFFFTTSSMGASTAAYDTSGELRWFTTRGYTKGMTMLSNGHILLSTDDPGINLTSTSGVVEIDMMGYVYHEYVIEGGYHHDAYELENGNLIILTSDKKSETLADYVIEIDRETGKVVKDWNLKEIVDKIDPEITKYYFNWGWINSIYYDKTTDSLLMSFRNMNSIVSLGYTSKEINWIMGNKKYWSKKFDKYLIKGVGDDFIYPLGQHSISVTKEGYISIFNNGYDSYEEEPKSCASFKNNASYAMLYKVDAKAKTAEVVWKYGGKEYFSYALSSFTASTDNHRIFTAGWHFRDDTPFNSKDCDQFSAETYESYIIDFDEKYNQVFKMYIKEGKFEVLKANIYNLESISVKPHTLKAVANYSVQPAKMTATGDFSYVELSKEDIKYLEKAEKIEYAMYADKNKIVINGILSKSDDVKVILVDLSGKGYEFTVKEPGSDILTNANANLLPKGRYYIFVKINDNYYNALQHVTVR